MEQHVSPTLQKLTSPEFGRPAKEANPALELLGAPHVQSFDWMLGDGLKLAIKHLVPMEFALPNESKVTFKFLECKLHKPAILNSIVPIKSNKVLPSECRQRGETYKGLFEAKLAWEIDGETKPAIQVPLGEIPVMVKSSACHLKGLSPAELVDAGEEEDCWGGFFVIKGHERLVRMLINTRKNYPVALQRNSWKNRGPLFSEKGIMMRSVSEDLRSVNNVMHFLTDGSVKLMFSHEKILCFVPLMLVLRALDSEMTDIDLAKKLLGGGEEQLYYKGCVLKMLRQLHEDGVHSSEEALNMLGASFRARFRRLPAWYTDEEVARFLLRRCICIHVEEFSAKLDCLVVMCQKLFSFVEDRCKPESVDSVMMQEALLSGHLYLQVLQDKLERWLILLRSVILKRAGVNKGLNYHLSLDELSQSIKRCGTFETSMSNFLATGNVTSISGLGLMQDKGLTIVAENINRMRYMSHFRAIHRGSFFQEMRTTDARQLLPDAWGFICPVHTPDGTPCGLLNHLARGCSVVTQPGDPASVLAVLGKRMDVNADGPMPVWLEGRIVGRLSVSRARKLAASLRLRKIEGSVPPHLEVCLLEPDEDKDIRTQFPGLYLYLGVGRMVRTTMHLQSRSIEFLGTLEQVHLQIAACPEELGTPGPVIPTHLELAKTAFLSNLACLIPMPDCNQSPRNMYQCQMGKQSMGTPTHTWHLQSETKLYRLQTPNAPLFRTAQYDSIALDNNAMGVNAVVAVISYTGYDMEDAMILNKSSYERGLAHGSIYKSEFLELTANCYFARDPSKPELNEFMDSDGLPYVGGRLGEADPMACSFDLATATYKVHRFHSKEEVIVESVKLCGSPQTSNRAMQLPKVCITFRVPRNPTVGDKFASRAGQKGICSQKWPAEDLPFTESGLVPDIIFNPHGFPSRMTIAMMIELMAGKSGSMFGCAYDATPFRFSEEETAIDHFGRLLVEGGYSYFGTERMYSGVDGREMNADIFVGVVYYQRLRHMVSDKWQVRSTGPVDPVTRQPVKGRRRGGGVRFGEMERDALISHGAAFLLQDRLYRCSDRSQAMCCTVCGSIISTCLITSSGSEGVSCRKCQEKSNVQCVELPHSLRYLVTQLASVNINMKVQLTP